MTEFETFRPILKQKDPSCFNGMVRVRKYKVTVELIDEPLDVIHERIRVLKVMNPNHHNNRALQAEANKYGLEL